MNDRQTGDRPVVSHWTVIGSQVSFADRWLRVRSDHVRTAEGDVIGPYHVIEYPDWVTIVGFTRESCRLLLVREYRHGVRQILWGLPGGMIDPDDGSDRHGAAEAAARRELLEETGFAGGDLEPLVNVHPNPSNQSNTAFCFLATGLQRVAPQRPGAPGESQEVVEADLIDVLAGLRAGNVTLHAVHVAALWAAAARIAADPSERFEAINTRLRHFLAGRDPLHRREGVTASLI